MVNIYVKRGTVCPIFKSRVLRKPVIDKMKSQFHAKREAAMSVFIYYRAIITGLRGFYAMMKISQVFDLQEKSITLRLFTIKI